MSPSWVRPAPVKMAKPEEMPEADVLVRNVKKSFDELLALNPHIGKDVIFAITTSTDPAFLSEYIPANLLFRFEDKQAILDEGTLMGRLRLLIEKMHRERRMLEIDKEIAQKVDEAMDKNQRDYYLHEQLHMISEELGEDDDTTAEAEEYRRKITALHLDEEREKKLLKEVDRLSKMQSSNQEGTVIRTYLDTCLDLPWNTFTEDDLDIAKAQRVLDRDHYGLKKVKERILEQLAVRQLTHSNKAPIICLLAKQPGGEMSQQELGMHFDLKPGSLSEILSKLELNGLIERSRNPKDRRQLTIRLTETGRENARIDQAARIRFRERAFSALTHDEREDLAEMLDKIRVTWEELDD